jgi:hypothetical protein
MTNAVKLCPGCSEQMVLEVRINSMQVRGQSVWFYSCRCGRVTTEIHQESAGAAARERAAAG